MGEITGKKIYEELRVKIEKSFTPDNVAVVDKAFELANEAHGEQKRK